MATEDEKYLKDKWDFFVAGCAAMDDQSIERHCPAEVVLWAHDRIKQLESILNRVKDEDIECFVKTGAYSLPQSCRAEIQRALES